MHSHDLGFILYDVPEGQILVDGVDIKALHLEDLRRYMSVLFQDILGGAPSVGSRFPVIPLSSTERILMSHMHSS